MSSVKVTDEAISQARRSDSPMALVGDGASPQPADFWGDAWEFEATLLGIRLSGEFWQDGRRWMEAQQAARKRSRHD